MATDNKPNYPLYQADWSLKDGRMFHVRCDSFEQFQEATTNIEGLLPKEAPAVTNHQETLPPPKPQPVPQVQTSTQNRQGISYTCQTCGGPAEYKSGTSKKGNPYRIIRCVSFPETVDKGGHSIFLRD